MPLGKDNQIAEVEIYTDGACSGNPGPGGWGALLKYKDREKRISGSEKNTTNNRMEMQAAIEALRILKKPCKINLFTDSIYLKKGMTEWMHKWQSNNWRKGDNKLVKNADLWQELHIETQKHSIIWNWVKGHADNEGNQIADQLAVLARDKAKGL